MPNYDILFSIPTHIFFYRALLGITTIAIIYARIPLPPQSVTTTQISRIIVGSTFRHSPIPPQIPPSIRLESLLYNVLFFPFNSAITAMITTIQTTNPVNPTILANIFVTSFFISVHLSILFVTNHALTICSLFLYFHIYGS